MKYVATGETVGGRRKIPPLTLVKGSYEATKMTRGSRIPSRTTSSGRTASPSRSLVTSVFLEAHRRSCSYRRLWLHPRRYCSERREDSGESRSFGSHRCQDDKTRHLEAERLTSSSSALSLMLVRIAIDKHGAA